MSNRPNYARHRRRRRARLRSATIVDLAEAARRLDACTCPTIATRGAGLVTFENYHRPGCPALKETR